MLAMTIKGAFIGLRLFILRCEPQAHMISQEIRTKI